MALKPTIYRVRVELADSDRNRFESLKLTLAMHPSESLERMTARLLVFCFNYGPELSFTKGLSTQEEPDVWAKSNSGEIDHWIEVGQPEAGRLRKACGKSRRVSVYAFGASTKTWWGLQGEAIDSLPRLQTWQIDWDEIQQAAALIERTVQLGVTIVGGTLYLDNGVSNVPVTPTQLGEADAN